MQPLVSRQRKEARPIAPPFRTRLLAALAVAIPAVVLAVVAPTAAPLGAAGGQLGSAPGRAQHVIVIQFDSVHYTRDNPNVPSDLEQMPQLLNFLKGNGVVLTNHHTAVISHAATGISTALTGVYPDRHGVPVSNSYRYYLPNGVTETAVALGYWTSPLFDPALPATPTDTTYNMLAADGHNTPAPWVPFTRAGLNVGTVAVANLGLENTGPDITNVFGTGSPEQLESQADSSQAFTDFVGVSIHCARAATQCSTANNGRPDLLTDEPGGYSGYSALHGAKYVNPLISPGGPMTDLDGDVIQDAAGRPGFPGFDGMTAAVSLSYVAAMQEHGIPVTIAYISDAHDRHPAGPAYGPGEAAYTAALASYDAAFGKFFARLAADGIDASNTLFVFTSDQGDHFVGGPPTPPGCDGVAVPCTYAQIGELNANLAGLLATQQGITTPFRVHSDSAPTIYITGNPARTAPVTRTFEQAAGSLMAVNPMTGTTEAIAQFMADPVEMTLLHMITADPARTPTFTLFGNPDYFLFAGAPNCAAPCVTQSPAFAWNAGGVSPDVTTTWLGMAGPGVQAVGVDGSIWSDHADVRPTIMALVGLTDDYAHDGRVLFETLDGWAVPASLQHNRGINGQLAQAYKQISSPVGQFGMASLAVSTRALESDTADDSTYTSLEAQLIAIGAQRDVLAGSIIALLEGAEFNGLAIDRGRARQLTAQAQALLVQLGAL